MSLYTEIETGRDLKYEFHPVSGTAMRFKVKAASDAIIALTTGPQESIPMYEIFLGIHGNTKSSISKNKMLPHNVEVYSPEILKDNKFRDFWIRWDSGNILVGKQDTESPIISWKDPEPFSITHYGVRTAVNKLGKWRICEPNIFDNVGSKEKGWLTQRNGTVPTGAVVGGQDISGVAIYVIRAKHNKMVLPGMLVDYEDVAYVTWRGLVYAKKKYQVLVGGPYRWSKNTGPASQLALAAGTDDMGEPLYVARVDRIRDLIVGYTTGSFEKCIYIDKRAECTSTEFQLLLR